MNITRRAKFAAVGAAAVVLSLAGVAVAYASIPGPDGVIHGCYKNTNPAQGALTTIDSAANCPSGTTSLNWSQTGPQGPAGPTGPQGPPGLSNVHVVVGPFTADGAEHEVDCPSGQVALSIVFNQSGPPFFDQFISSNPVLNGSGQPTGYVFRASNTVPYGAEVTCANAT